MYKGRDTHYYSETRRCHSGISLVVLLLLPLLLITSISTEAQEPYRVGTTAANFLEIGFGSAGNALGDAYVSNVRDVSAIYWNPAGLGYMQKHELMAVYQPWIADINHSFMGFAFAHDVMGTFGVGIITTTYGEEQVTTVERPEGTGETFDGQDLAFSLTYSRRLVEWFSFGFTGKFVNSRIWNESASAAAVDLGAIVNTSFLSRTGNPAHGLAIGMSISNYGTRMRYSGIDLKRPIDISNDNGNFETVPGVFELDEWELPLIFRLGISFQPIFNTRQQLTIAVDALHPNNNSESINVGGEYTFRAPGFADFSLRGGYKALFMVESEYGFSGGFGLKLYYLGDRSVKFDYAFRDIGLLGGAHTYSLSLMF